MSKTLPTLIKITQQKLEDKQKELAKLERMMQEMEARKLVLEGQRESGFMAASAENNLVMLQQSGTFSLRVAEEIQDIKEAQEIAQNVQKEKRLELQKLFAERKQYEILLERKQQECKDRIAKKQQELLDDISQNR